jgi:MerR family transcriptional regulator, heat shock protein HspR
MDRPRYSISVAAELAGMHPQTLRMYDARGLVSPRRTPGGTRRYSEADLERLRKINQLTTELGMNLVGAAHVLVLEETVQRLLERVGLLEQQLADEGVRLRRELDTVHRSYRRDLIIYKPPKHPERWISRN